jgi:hypothetical protein
MPSTQKFGAIDDGFGFEEEVLLDVLDATEDTVQTPVSGVHRRSSQDRTRVAPRTLNAFDPRISEVRELYEQDDVDAALTIASAIASSAGDDASNANDSNDPHATGDYTAIFSADDVLAKVSGLRGVPRVTASLETLRALPFDPKIGFLLSLMDGTWCVRELCDLSGMHEDEMIRTLHDLAERGVIAFD